MKGDFASKSCSRQSRLRLKCKKHSSAPNPAASAKMERAGHVSPVECGDKYSDENISTGKIKHLDCSPSKRSKEGMDSCSPLSSQLNNCLNGFKTPQVSLVRSRHLFSAIDQTPPVASFGSEPPRVCQRVPTKQDTAGRRRLLYVDVSKKSENSPTIQALSQSLPNLLVCRDSELARLRCAIELMLSNPPESNGSLYISGPPGSGKTACVKMLMEELTDVSSAKAVYINCMSVRSTSGLYKLILAELGLSTAGRSLNSLEKLSLFLSSSLAKRKGQYVLIFDEIDQIGNKLDYSAVLRKIFSIPRLKDSCVSCVIGISNSLDLADKQVSLSGHKIKRLQFRPYSASEIAEILKTRLLTASDNMDPAAVELCARKVSAVTGDVRKALDICKVAVSQLKVQQKQSADKMQTPDSKSSVGVSHILHAVNQVYGSRLPKDIPLQQKLILVSLLKLKKRSSCPVTVNTLFMNYRSACSLVHISPCCQTEMLGLCELMESQGLVAVVRVKKDTSQSKISLQLDESSVRLALRDQSLLSTVLND